ncbi:MAG: damage-inducible protein DinB, partial [Bacillus sp. (in: firmicutes)]
METIKTMFEHMAWANERILDVMKTNNKDNKGFIRLYSHLLMAEKVWLTRLKGMDSQVIQIWPNFNMAVSQGIGRLEER